MRLSSPALAIRPCRPRASRRSGRRRRRCSRAGWTSSIATAPVPDATSSYGVLGPGTRCGRRGTSASADPGRTTGSSRSGRRSGRAGRRARPRALSARWLSRSRWLLLPGCRWRRRSAPPGRPPRASRSTASRWSGSCRPSRARVGVSSSARSSERNRSAGWRSTARVDPWKTAGSCATPSRSPRSASSPRTARAAAISSELRTRLVEIRETERPEGIEEAEAAAAALAETLREPPRLATPGVPGRDRRRRRPARARARRPRGVSLRGFHAVGDGRRRGARGARRTELQDGARMTLGHGWGLSPRHGLTGRKESHGRWRIRFPVRRRSR